MKCPSEFGLYDRMVVLQFPDFMLKKHGGYYITKDSCSVDICLADEIKELWNKGVHTMGCCCGHDKTFGYIQVLSEDDKQKMLLLGYKYCEIQNENHDAFIPKSKHI